jgi:hypothetical protein
MDPKNVYVIYDNNDDKILSVHPYKEFAEEKKMKLIVNNGVGSYHTSRMRYSVVSLDRAIEWLQLPFTPDSD